MEISTEAFMGLLGIGGGGMGGFLLAQLVVSNAKKKLLDLDKIPGMEGRIAALEQQALSHNETKDAVIRMEQNLINLGDKVNSLSELLMRKVLKLHD